MGLRQEVGGNSNEVPYRLHCEITCCMLLSCTSCSVQHTVHCTLHPVLCCAGAVLCCTPRLQGPMRAYLVYLHHMQKKSWPFLFPLPPYLVLRAVLCKAHTNTRNRCTSSTALYCTSRSRVDGETPLQLLQNPLSRILVCLSFSPWGKRLTLPGNFLPCVFIYSSNKQTQIQTVLLLPPPPLRPR